MRRGRISGIDGPKKFLGRTLRKFPTKPYLREVSLRSGDVPGLQEYPFSIPSIRDLGILKFHPDVTFLVGENGSGKSTLLEAIALGLGFGPEGGTRNVRFQTADTISSLYRHLKLVRGTRRPKDHYFLRAESFYNVATYMDALGDPEYLKGYGGKSIHVRSHGEAFIALLTIKLRGNGLYLLDEPESALSPSRQLAAISAIHQLVEHESQFIIATHSPILLAYPRSKIVAFDRPTLPEIGYEDTEHFSITKDFLNNHSRRIERLLAEDSLPEKSAR
jgi:predicted ATPase